jgi:hypothetical protein
MGATMRFLPRRRLVALAVVIAAPATAAGQAAEPCEVRFSRAPSAVRRVIERWVSAEVGCRTSLEIEVVPRQGGLHLRARSPSGERHERVVPDAESAGVLVASWIADDAGAGRSRPVAPFVRAVSAPAPRAAFLRTPTPGIADHRSRSWLTFGALGRLLDDGHQLGLGGDVEIARRGRLAAGLGLWIVRTAFEGEGLRSPTELATVSLEAIDVHTSLLLGWTLGDGAWRLQLQVGLGVVGSDARYVDVDRRRHEGSDLAPAFEASALVSRALGDVWAIAAGPRLLAHEALAVGSAEVDRPDGIWLVAGLRRRL